MTSDDAWVHYAAPRPDAAVRLFCFPYAGAGTHAFREFARELPERIEVAALRLPGRAAEPPLTRIDSVVERLAEAVVPHLTKPSVFFGHSMGAHLAFELARHLARTGRPGPDRLLVSGCPAPHEKPADEPGQALPMAMFTGLEDPDQPELREVALDSLRADLTLAQSYEYAPGPPLNVPIHAFHGHEDPIAGGSQMAEWVTHTSRYFTILGLAGDHFFIHSRRSQLLAGIAAAIG